MASTLGERIKQIIREKNLKQVEFATSLGISANYVYLLTSDRKKTISDTLAKLIESTYGYSADWIKNGTPPTNASIQSSDLMADIIQKVQHMNCQELRAIYAFIYSINELMKDQ